MMIPNRIAVVLLLCILAIVGSIVEAVEVVRAKEECDADGPDCLAEDAEEPYCKGWAAIGECEKNPNYMLLHCQVSCDKEASLLDAVAKYGKRQRVAVEGKDALKTLEVIRKTVTYMENDIYGPNPTHTLSEEALAECTNREELCAFWAAIGECEANEAYMKTTCAPSCQTCEMIDMEYGDMMEECGCPPLGDDVRPGLRPGELNAMFERIVKTAPGNQTTDDNGNDDIVIEEGMTNYYTVHVHSRPVPLPENEEPIIISKERDLKQPPWVVTFENFLSPEECKHLIHLGYKVKYKRSEVQADGSDDRVQSLERSSENAWCSHRNGCRNDTIVQQVHDRIAKVTGLPAEHSEDLQLLKYETGQFYRPHHDYIEHQRDARCGPRILTFFLYLSDVEEGGATKFPTLDLAVKPKVGKALLWPSVLDSNPLDKDPRTEHEAQDVIKGAKFGANAWLHLHDYMDAKAIGCI